MTALKTFWKEARKTVVALVGALIAWGWVVVDSDATSISAHEWMLLAVGAATAVGVYKVTNSSDDGATTLEAAVTVFAVVFLAVTLLLVMFG